MPIKEPLCIIRDLSNGAFTSKSMSCLQILKEAQTGRWGKSWQIDEVYLLDLNTPHVLRMVGRYSEQRGLQIIEVDKKFNQYLRSIDIVQPDSPAISTLKRIRKDPNYSYLFFNRA